MLRKCISENVEITEDKIYNAGVKLENIMCAPAMDKIHE